MKNYIKASAILLGLLAFSCSPEEMTIDNTTKSTDMHTTYAIVSNTWNFDDWTDWTDASQNGPGFYQLSDGTLKIFTNANTWERSKVKTISSYTDGTYSWNVYIPEMGVGDMASIGAFLYSDDTHELDFEIGYGSQTLRNQLQAEADDLIVYMTSQGNPYYSVQSKIKRNKWYNLKMELKLNNKKRYVATWKIDNVTMATRALTYGNRTKFNIFCSVENLTFMGDHIPQQQNYALFDSVEFYKGY